MKRKALSLILMMGFLAASAQAQAPSVNKPAIVPLDAEDERFIKDITQELMILHLDLEIIDDKLKTIQEHLRSLFRPYCKCTDKEFEEYSQDKGLASVINRMREIELNAKDRNLYYDDVLAENNLQNLRRKKQSIFDQTMKLFETRMSQSADRHGVSGIANYKLDLINRRFAYLGDSVRVPSLMDSINEYLLDYSKKAVAELKEAARRIRQQNEELKAKLREKKEKEAQPSRRPKAKGKP